MSTDETSQKDKQRIFQGDCLEVMRGMEDCSYTSILSDVPYGLSFMGKKWDYDVPSVEVFKEMYRITQHGGYLFCFGGSRTFHRIACNIEDAGWILKDTIMWLYGSGFPKSHNISKAIDKKYGLEREQIGETKTSGKQRNCMQGDFNGEYYESQANHQLAKDFEGYGTALKPAFEPIIIAHKPCDGSYVDNVEKYGIGGLNIDECRVGNGELKVTQPIAIDKGRFPANIVTDGSDEVCGTMDKQSGILKSGKLTSAHTSKENRQGTSMFAGDKSFNHKGYEADSGGASRFFAKTPYSEKEKEPRLGRFPANIITDGSDEVCKTMDEQSGISKSSGGRIGNATGIFEKSSLQSYEKGQSGLGDIGGASRFFYCAKASQKEKNENLERLQPKKRDQSRNEDQKSMNGGEGNPYNRGAKKVKNPHPTVKPIALMEYLAKMLKQPNNKTKLLDPYMGSGTTLIACKRLGIDCDGIEMNPEYILVAKARLGQDLSEYDIKDEEIEKPKLQQTTIWDFMK